MNTDFQEKLFDAAYDTAEAWRDAGQPFDRETLTDLLYEAINSDFDGIRLEYPDVSIDVLGQMVDDCVEWVEQDMRHEPKYTYQMIDGIGRPHFLSTDIYEEARDNYHWGTYGKDGKQPLRYVRVLDCDTAHLQAILSTQGNLSPLLKKLITDELQRRECKLPEELFQL